MNVIVVKNAQEGGKEGYQIFRQVKDRGGSIRFRSWRGAIGK